MLMKVHYFIENIRGPKPVIQRMSKNEVTFPKTNSMFYIGTAGARAFGRGDTITDLHCSEYAYWSNPKALIGGLLQAVPASGEVWMESTGNGMNDYAQRCMMAAKGDGRFRLHFLPWHTFEEYKSPVSEEEAVRQLGPLREDLEEPMLAGSLTARQLLWRRFTLADLSYDVAFFKQEYPMTLDECFQKAKGSVFIRVLYQPTDDWVSWDTDSYILKGHPDPLKSYVIGVDIAGGVEKDYSTMEVICLDTNEQVAEYSSNRIAPDTFAYKVASWGKHFGEAYIVPESNNHGVAMLAYLDDIYPVYMIYKRPGAQTGEESKLMNLGFRTTPRSKPLIIGLLRQAVSESLVIHSPILRNEMTTFIEHEDGTLGGAEGCHDDLVIALACANVGIPKASLYGVQPVRAPRQARDPFSMESIIHDLRLRGFGFPISRQDRP